MLIMIIHQGKTQQMNSNKSEICAFAGIQWHMHEVKISEQVNVHNFQN